MGDLIAEFGFSGTRLGIQGCILHGGSRVGQICSWHDGLLEVGALSVQLIGWFRHCLVAAPAQRQWRPGERAAEAARPHSGGLGTHCVDAQPFFI